MMKGEFHNIDPVWSPESGILILGSFPSRKSREEAFFYAHPQNRFWRMLATVLDRDVPKSVDEKKRLILDNGLALWDVLAYCEIELSKDGSIRNERPNDLNRILCGCRIRKILCNGRTAYSCFLKHDGQLGIPAVCMPSTSPANAACSFEKLVETWGKELREE